MKNLDIILLIAVAYVSFLFGVLGSQLLGCV